MALKFAAVIYLVYFTIFVNAAKKSNFCKSVLQKLNELESQGTFRNVFYLTDALKGLNVVFGSSKSLNSEQQLSYLCFYQAPNLTPVMGQMSVQPLRLSK